MEVSLLSTLHLVTGLIGRDLHQRFCWAWLSHCHVVLPWQDRGAVSRYTGGQDEEGEAGTCSIGRYMLFDTPGLS